MSIRFIDRIVVEHFHFDAGRQLEQAAHVVAFPRDLVVVNRPECVVEPVGRLRLLLCRHVILLL